MNFELTEEQKLLQEMVRDFAQKEILPLAKSLEESHTYPNELLKKLSGLGILGMTIPPEYEGIKTDSLSLVLALEELSKVLPSISVIISVHCSLFCYSILKFGTKPQKEKYLPRAAKGKIIGAFSLTEPGAGSDATNLKTKSVRKGDKYILNGTKSWITTGSESDAFIIFAATDTGAKHKRLNAFIVEKSLPGLQISKIEEKMGLHSSPAAEIVLEDCQVPIENLLGEEGKGSSIAFHCLDCSRIGIAAQSVGLSQRALDEAARYAKQREAFGQPILQHELIGCGLAEAITKIEAARWLTYRAAWLIDAGKMDPMATAMAKQYASKIAMETTDFAIQTLGGYGYLGEYKVERYHRDAKITEIYEGTSEIQKLTVLKYLLRKF